MPETPFRDAPPRLTSIARWSELNWERATSRESCREASHEVKCLAQPRGRHDWLRGEFVFVEQAAEPVVTAEAIELQLFCARCRFSYRRWLRERWPLAERAAGEGCQNWNSALDPGFDTVHPVSAFAQERTGRNACTGRQMGRSFHEIGQ